MLGLLILFILLLVGIGIYDSIESRFAFSKETAALFYEKQDKLVTSVEKSFLDVLNLALGEDYRVFAKVRLTDVIRIKKELNSKARKKASKQIKDERMDFVICRSDDLSIVLLIALDVPLFTNPPKSKREEFLEMITKTVGIPFLWITADKSYTVSEMRAKLAGYL